MGRWTTRLAAAFGILFAVALVAAFLYVTSATHLDLGRAFRSGGAFGRMWSEPASAATVGTFTPDEQNNIDVYRSSKDATVNITSVVGASGNAGQANYAAAKAGVAGMTRALARELGSRNITVNCVAPGFIETDMTDVLPEAQKAALLQQIPLNRLGKPEEIAQAVAFLASREAGYITGTELHVNGGMYMN